MKRLFVAIGVSIAISGCTTVTDGPQISREAAVREANRQKTMAYRLQLDRQARLEKVSQALLIANADLCGQTRMLSGFAAFTPEDFQPRSDRALAKQALKLHDRPTVLWVTPGLPAERAGLRKGDLITAIDGTDIGFGKLATRNWQKAIGDANEYAMTVYRDGQPVGLLVQPAAACDFDVLLTGDRGLTAFASGSAVHVPVGVMSVVQSDDELALVVGRELAHNVMGHVDLHLKDLAGAAMGGVKVGKSLFDKGVDMGAAMFSQAIEIEADYVGLYYAGRAGYQTAEAADIWRRIAFERPSAIGMSGSTHPATVNRIVAIERAANEFNRKKAQGAPLVPTLKRDAQDR